MPQVLGREAIRALEEAVGLAELLVSGGEMRLTNEGTESPELGSLWGAPPVGGGQSNHELGH